MIKKLLALLVLGTTAAIAQPVISVTQMNTCYYPQAPNNVTVNISNNTSATSFSWTSSAPNCNDSLLSAGGFMAVFHMKCCGTHTVICTGYVNGTPNWTTSTIVNFNCLPVVTISSNTLIACLGTGATLSVSAPGAMSYTWLPTSMGGASIIVNPLSNTCYTALASDMNGCVGMASTCFSVLPLPQVTATNNTFCLGSSTTFTASGANIYVWNNGAFGNPMKMTLTIPSIVQVIGTDLNGCTNNFSLNVIPDTTCAMVWPGDANSDGTVDVTDVFELGLYANQTGTPRNPSSNVYQAEFATAWNGTGSNSQNKAHIDCNGDGTVNANDTVAILNNFGLNHAFKTTGPSGGVPDIRLVPPAYFPNDGSWIHCDIVVGADNNVLKDLYGIAFEIPIPPGLIDPAGAYVKYTPSFLNNNNQNITFRRGNTGVIYCATVRTDKKNVLGFGKIGEFHFRAVPGSTGTVNFWVNGHKKTDKDANMLGVMGSNTTAQLLPVGIAEKEIVKSVSVYPNPATGNITLSSPANGEITYSLTDLFGRSLIKGAFENETSIDLSELKTGIYFLQLESDNKKVTRKLVVE